MKRHYLIKKWHLMMLLKAAFAFSQVKGTVKDQSGKPVAYASISVENEGSGVTSEENGAFSLEADPEKMMVVSALGYETIRVKAKDAGEIMLQSVAIGLEEVKISKPEKTVTAEIGEYRSGGFRYQPGYAATARLFEVKEKMEKYPYLKSVTFYAMNDVKNAKMRIRLLEAAADGSPGRDLINENILVTLKKGDRNVKVELEQYALQVPEKFFVVLEKIFIAENKLEETITYKMPTGEKKTLNTLRYQPYFGYQPSVENTSWYYAAGKWNRVPLVKIEKYDHFESILMRKYHDKYLEPAIKLTLSN